MDESPLTVVDTNVLLHLAAPVVDGRGHAPCGADPLKIVVIVYNVHDSGTVLDEESDTVDNNFLRTVARLVLDAADHFRTNDVDDIFADFYGLDPEKSHKIRLANDLGDLFVTDEFNSTNYLLVSLALEDRNTLFTTSHVHCSLTDRVPFRSNSLMMYFPSAQTSHVNVSNSDTWAVSICLGSSTVMEYGSIVPSHCSICLSTVPKQQ